jgi:hypothetical protein
MNETLDQVDSRVAMDAIAKGRPIPPEVAKRIQERAEEAQKRLLQTQGVTNSGVRRTTPMKYVVLEYPCRRVQRLLHRQSLPPGAGRAVLVSAHRSQPIIAHQYLDLSRFHALVPFSCPQAEPTFESHGLP